MEDKMKHIKLFEEFVEAELNESTIN